MIDINTSSYPLDKPQLLPNQMVIDAGFTNANFNTLLSLSPSNLDLSDVACDFAGFFKLYDLLKTSKPKIRENLTEFGYSPYNLMLIINSLQLHKQDFAALIGCSFSKILANTTHRNNSYFRPLVGSQWEDLLHCYVSMVDCSDQYHGNNHTADDLFFMRAEKSLPLSMPSSI